jgi:hypothetical protein
MMQRINDVAKILHKIIVFTIVTGFSLLMVHSLYLQPMEYDSIFLAIFLNIVVVLILIGFNCFCYANEYNIEFMF